MVEKRSEIAPQDVFELLKLDAVSFDLSVLRQDQKHPDRRRFVNNVGQYLEEHNAAAVAAGAITPKPEGYYSIFKSVLSSKTGELFKLIEACQKGDFDEFVQGMKLLDLETLRRMGELPRKATKPFAGQDVVPGVVKGKRKDFTAILRGQGVEAEDVRRAAVRKRYREDWNQ